MRNCNHLFSLLVAFFYGPLGQAMENPIGKEKRWFSHSSSPPCKMVKITNETPLDVTEDLNVSLSQLSQSIYLAYQQADAMAIEDAYARFAQLIKSPHYSAQDWHLARQTVNQWIAPPFPSSLYQWPSQTTDQEIIGGHLFYPPHLNAILDCPYTEDLIERRDYVFALAAAAHHHHSLAKYYLLRTLEDMALVPYEEMNKEQYNFFCNGYKEALEELHQCQDHPDACYVLGNNYNSYRSGKINILKYDSLKAYEFFTKGENVRNRLAALELKQNDIIDFPTSPTIEEYLTLAREEHYGPAYISAADLVGEQREREKERLSYLQEALELPYYPALMEIAYIYKRKGDLSNAIRYYEEAGKKGITQGYIEAGILVGGFFPPFSLGSKLEFETLAALSEEKINQAQYYYEAAGKAYDPQGWAYLAKYCKTLLVPTVLKGHPAREQEFKAQDLRALEQGIKLGSNYCYALAQTCPEHYDRLITTYGPATHGAYYKYIKQKFLK